MPGFSPPVTERGRREDRVRAAPAVSCARWIVKTHTSIQVQRRHPAFPARWCYGLLRALPGDRAFLPPSLARRGSVFTNLAPASGRQDHTTSPSASVCVRLSQAPRPPHPTPRVVTCATPLSSGEMGQAGTADLPDEAGQEWRAFSRAACTICFMTNRTFKSGESREQPSLFPPRIEDYVGPDNPVRAIDSFVNVLDLAKLGFRHADRRAGVGQPPYDPSDLLKLYLYGYINQIRSSRRLEREACRNLELIWLLKNLKPGYRTIASFRKENWAALKTANRSFVLLLRELSLVGGTLVAVDGALFHGNASKDSIFTRRKLAKQIAKLDQEIEDYGKSLDANDATEARQRAVGSGDGNKGGSDVGDKMKELMAKRERARADLKDLEAGDKGQMSKTDSDARLLSKGDQTLAGYNVQSVVDDKHKLIVASEVVNRSDAGH